MFLKRMFILISAFFLVGACSFEVKKANAPTNPPKVAVQKFSPKMIEGDFVGEVNVLFFWPTEMVDEKKNKKIPMTFDEQVSARAKIVRFLEGKNLYQKEVNQFSDQLYAKYGAELEELLYQHSALECNLLCDTEEFFECDPPDLPGPGAKPLDHYKIPENEEEAAAVALCQENTDKRMLLKEKKAADPISDKLTQAEDRLEAASTGFTKAVGDENSIADFTGLEFSYDNQFCFVGREEEVSSYDCEKSAQKRVYIKLIYGATIVSNYGGEDPSFQITDIQLDNKNGYITFSAPALDFRTGEPVVFGEWFYDLEINFVSDLMRIEGDVVLRSKTKDNGRVGRIFVEGKK